MLNFKDYVNLLPRPEKTEFTVTYAYKGGRVQTLINLRGKKREDIRAKGWLLEDTINEYEYQKALSEFNSKNHELYLKFKRDLLFNLGISGHPKANALFEKAWERGSGEGYIGVYEAADDLVELLI